MRLDISCDTLGSLADGSARAIIDSAINKAVADIDDRGDEDGKARTVAITLTLQRRSNGEVETVVQAAAKLPPYQTPGTTARIRKQKEGLARLQFNDADPKDPNQSTIDERLKDR